MSNGLIGPDGKEYWQDTNGRYTKQRDIENNRFTSANAPTAQEYGVGQLWIDGQQYWSDGNSFSPASDNSSANVAVTNVQKLPVAVFGQDSTGRYLCTDKTPANGNYGRQLFWYDGSIRQFPSGGTISNITGSLVKSNGGIKTYEGNAISGYYHSAKLLKSGAILACVYNTDSKYYLVRIDETTNTISQTLGGTDKKAVLNVSSTSGKLVTEQSTNIRILHDRSILECTTRDGRHAIIFVEYNVNSARTSGGANDQCFAWVSYDDGITWSKIIEFNTNGTHNINHFHSVLQDSYTSFVYFFTGDVGDACSIIRWDTIAPALPANTNISDISSVKGWECIYGNELCRYGDVVFTDTAIFGLPDCDAENSEPWTEGFTSQKIDKGLRFISKIESTADRVPNNPPLIVVSAKNGYVYGTLSKSITADLRNRLYTSANGKNWKLAAKLSYFGNGILYANLFEDASNNIIGSTLQVRSGNFVDGESGSCVVFNLEKVSGALGVIDV